MNAVYNMCRKLKAQKQWQLRGTVCPNHKPIQPGIINMWITNSNLSSVRRARKENYDTWQSHLSNRC